MKILSYITVALMLLQAAVARAETITSGNFQYEIVEFMGYDEEEAVVVGLAEGFVPSGQLAFPSSVKYNGKNVKVVGIGWSNHAGHEGDAPVIGGQAEITSIKIPRYMRFIGRIEFKITPWTSSPSRPRSLSTILKSALSKINWNGPMWPRSISPWSTAKPP